eukprot:COSAG02_NODE_1670_length_11394_cov_4.791855_16_plen_469_part_00
MARLGWPVLVWALKFQLQALDTSATVAMPTGNSLLPAFSWETLPVWAFPGGAVELSPEMQEHFARFQQITIFAINASRTGAAGALAYRPNQEVMLQKQAAVLRASAPNSSLFAYLELCCSQVSYEAQAEFNRPEHSDLWLYTDKPDRSGRTIDNFQRRAVSCAAGDCPQWNTGTAIVYDWCNPRTRHYFLQQVIAFVDASPHLDGAFFDEGDTFAHMFAPALLNSSATAQYQQCALDFIVQLIQHMSAAGKIAIVSTKTYTKQFPTWESTLEQAHRRYGGMAYIESFCCWDDDYRPNSTAVCGSRFECTADEAQSREACCYMQLRTVQRRAAMQVAQQVHSTYTPPSGDYNVALVAFLISAGNHSYWGTGHGWGATKYYWPWLADFSRPVGAPKGPATEEHQPPAPPLPQGGWVKFPRRNGVYGCLPPGWKPGGAGSQLCPRIGMSLYDRAPNPCYMLLQTCPFLPAT